MTRRASRPACARSLVVGDPAYRTVKGILAAGTEHPTRARRRPTMAAVPAHLRGPGGASSTGARAATGGRMTAPASARLQLLRSLGPLGHARHARRPARPAGARLDPRTPRVPRGPPARTQSAGREAKALAERIGGRGFTESRQRGGARAAACGRRQRGPRSPQQAETAHPVQAGGPYSREASSTSRSTPGLPEAKGFEREVLEVGAFSPRASARLRRSSYWPMRSLHEEAASGWPLFPRATSRTASIGSAQTMSGSRSSTCSSWPFPTKQHQLLGNPLFFRKVLRGCGRPGPPRRALSNSKKKGEPQGALRREVEKRGCRRAAPRSTRIRIPAPRSPPVERPRTILRSRSPSTTSQARVN